MPILEQVMSQILEPQHGWLIHNDQYRAVSKWRGATKLYKIGRQLVKIVLKLMGSGYWPLWEIPRPMRFDNFSPKVRAISCSPSSLRLWC